MYKELLENILDSEVYQYEMPMYDNVFPKYNTSFKTYVEAIFDKNILSKDNVLELTNSSAGLASFETPKTRLKNQKMAVIRRYS